MDDPDNLGKKCEISSHEKFISVKNIVQNNISMALLWILLWIR